MKIAYVFSTALLALSAIVGSAANADDVNQRNRSYEVRIVNITKDQVFSPPVLVTHSKRIALFKVGEEALHELVLVAEDGNGAPLADLVRTLPQVADAQANMAPIPPGMDATYVIHSKRGFDVFSVVAMLVNTNDAFFAIDSKSLPMSRNSRKTYYALGYDAGSEGNNEDCAYVPGPACAMGSGNLRSTGDAEGYVHIHNGVHGIADLAADKYDWRNPVAKVTIKRIR